MAPESRRRRGRAGRSRRRNRGAVRKRRARVRRPTASASPRFFPARPNLIRSLMRWRRSGSTARIAGGIRRRRSMTGSTCSRHSRGQVARRRPSPLRPLSRRPARQAQSLFRPAGAGSGSPRRRHSHMARLLRTSGGVPESLYRPPPRASRHIWFSHRDELRDLTPSAARQTLRTPACCRSAIAEIATL